MAKFKWPLKPKPKFYTKEVRGRLTSLHKSLRKKYGVKSDFQQAVVDGEINEDQRQELLDFVDWYFTD